MSEIQKTIDKLNGLKWSHVVFLGAALGGGFLLWNRYQADMVGYLPYLILLLCPLIHVFMHRGHGGHGSHQEQKREHDKES